MAMTGMAPVGMGSARIGDAERRSWQADAVAAFHQSVDDEGERLRASLAARVTALTGCVVTASSVVVDGGARVAFLALDAVRFRLWRHDVVLLRPCAHCGTGEFASAPLTSREDLGHALGLWRPLHHACEADDPPDT